MKRARADGRVRGGRVHGGRVHGALAGRVGGAGVCGAGAGAGLRARGRAGAGAVVRALLLALVCLALLNQQHVGEYHIDTSK